MGRLRKQEASGHFKCEIQKSPEKLFTLSDTPIPEAGEFRPICKILAQKERPAGKGRARRYRELSSTGVFLAGGTSKSPFRAQKQGDSSSGVCWFGALRRRTKKNRESDGFAVLGIRGERLISSPRRLP